MSFVKSAGSDSTLERLNAHENLLKQLGKLPAQKETFRVFYNGRFYTSAPIVSKHNFLIRFLRFIFFRPGPNTSDSLASLRDFFDEVAVHIKKDPNLKNRYAPLVEQAFQGLRQLFEVYRSDNSAEGILKRNDILEALSVAYRKEDSLNDLLDLKIGRIAAAPLQKIAATLNEASIPLVRFSDIEQATKCLREAAVKENKSLAEMTLQEVQHHLGLMLTEENVPMGRLIDAMYKHEILHLNAVNKAATWVAGRNNRSKKNVTPKSIAAFLKRLNISPEFELNQQLYAYSEVFTTRLREETSNDAAFQRNFKPEVVEELLLKQANELQAQILRTCGEGNLIISNSFNRFRMHQIKKGGFDPVKGPVDGVHKKFNITGKVMSSSEKNIRAAQHEKSYTGQFAFSIKNMLGSEDGRDTSITAETLIPQQKLKSDPQTAKRKLLDCITNMVNRHDVIMNVQRLAPEDPHHFNSPVAGKILSKEESCRVLIRLLEQRKEKGTEQELEQLRELLGVFSEQSEKEKECSTINIQGTQSSVNTKALKKHSEILAQNDRKIMMMQHDDGSVSIHAFIGATGVNNVDVTAVASPRALSPGKDLGSMGFGNESNKAGWQKGLVAKDSIEIQQKAGRLQELGKRLGFFGKNGSTVISLYFSQDVVPTNELDAFTNTVRYKIEHISIFTRIRNCFCAIIGKYFGMKPTPSFKVSRAIELKTRLGDLVALPKNYVAFNAVVDVISDQWIKDFKKQPIELSMVLSAILDRYCQVYDSTKIPVTPQEKVAHEIYSAAKKKKEERTEDENILLEKLDRALRHYVSH